MAKGSALVGNVVPLFGERKGRGGKPKGTPIKREEFQSAVSSPDNLDRVRFAAATMLQSERVFPIINPRILRATHHTAKDFGTLESYPRSDVIGDEAVVSHEDFPNYLMSEDLSRSSALLLAATSVISYVSVKTWAGKLNYKQSQAVYEKATCASMQPEYSQLWQESKLRQLDVDPHTITYRMAASLALEASGVPDFDPSAEPPFPHHVAALADPYTDQQMRLLYASTKIF